MGTTAVPVDRVSHASRSAEEAWDVLSRVYMQVRPLTSSPQASVRVDTVSTPGLAVDRGRASAAACRFDPSPGQLNLMTVLGGHLGMDAGRAGQVVTGPDECFLYLPDRTADLSWDDLQILPVRLAELEVAELAAAQTGMPEEAFRFLSPRPLSTGRGQVWVRTAKLLTGQVHEGAEASMNPLVHQALVVAAAAAALEVFPNTAMTRGYLAAPGDVRPAAVRRAVAFVDAHLSLPITIGDAAAAAGTSPFALRHAFQQHLGTTFTAHLRRARCDAARQDLDGADPSADVLADTARRWGFSSAADLRSALDDDLRSP